MKQTKSDWLDRMHGLAARPGNATPMSDDRDRPEAHVIVRIAPIAVC